MGSLCSIAFRREVTTEVFWVGRGGIGSVKIDLANKWREVPLKGGYRAQSSKRRIPRDQISDSKLYPFPSMISGER